MKRILSLTVAILAAASSSSVFAALTQEQIVATVAEVTKGVGMKKGIVYPLYKGYNPLDDENPTPTPTPDGGSGQTPSPTPTPTPDSGGGQGPEATPTPTPSPTPVSYTLTYTAGMGGSLAGSATQTVLSGGSGTEVTATANSGYTFSGWDDGNTNPTRTDSNVASNQAFSAQFEAISYFTLTYSAGSGGTVDGAVSQTVAYNGIGTYVTAVPDTGYSFVSWSDGHGYGRRVDIDVTSNKSVSASFAKNTYLISYIAGSGGTISGATTQSVLFGETSSSVTAVPDSGYEFISWNDGSTSASRSDVATSHGGYTATFAPAGISYTLTYSAGSGGTISGVATQTVANGASGSAVTATPNSGYTFSAWSDGSTSASRTDIGTANISVSATFAPIVYYTLTYTAGFGGTIEGTTTQTVASGGSGTDVSATANPGYLFDSWSDGSTSPSRQDTNVTGNQNLSASFIQIDSFFRGAPAPWGNDAVLAARNPKMLSATEMEWVAANFDLLTNEQLSIYIGSNISGTSYANRQALSSMMSSMMGAIIATPGATAYGSVGPYAAAYARFVVGLPYHPNFGIVLNPDDFPLASNAIAYNTTRISITLAQWNDILSFPLNATQIARLQTTFSVSTGWNASVDAAARATLLQRINGMTPAF